MESCAAGKPLIIEASLNGQTPRSRNPHVPYTDEEIVEQAVACMDAGAAMVHNHTEEPVIGGSGRLDIERYASAWRKLLTLRPDAILTATMPVGQEGVPVEARYAHIEDNHFTTAPVEALGDGYAVMLGQHGPITVGENLHHAMERAVTLEEAAKTYFVARGIGEVKEFTSAQSQASFDYYQNRYGQR